MTPPRVSECPVQLEAVLNASTPFGIGNPRIRTEISAIEARIIRVHVDTRIQADGHPDRIDPDKWRPVIMSFRQFYGLGGRLHPSQLSEFPEELFKPAALRARLLASTRLPSLPPLSLGGPKFLRQLPRRAGFPSRHLSGHDY